MGHIVSNYEIVSKTANLYKILVWRYWLKTEIVLPWPRKKWINLSKGVDAESSDPNYHFRPYLEECVGKQGKDWDWREHISPAYEVYGFEHLYDDRLIIKFRKSSDATAFILKYGAGIA